jgi:tRNA (cmo5U34)-methyltransferase
VKSTVEEIRERFDKDVERFSDLAKGNPAQVDSLLSLDLIAQAAAAANPQAKSLLDIGTGAGNYALKVLQHLPRLDVTLLDLSQPMLERAHQRVAEAGAGKVDLLQGDIREVSIGEARFDVIVAAAVLHHLRTDDEWKAVFAKLYQALKPGGSVWIYDLVQHSNAGIEALMFQRYGDYLLHLQDEPYRDKVLGWIYQEDTPRPLMFQLDLLREVGFAQLEILHKTSCFAAFGALK